MAVSRLCIMVLVYAAKILLSVIVLAKVSETMPNLKYACLGDTVQLFKKLDFDLCNGSVSLIINGKNLIAIWSYQHCIQNSNISKEYTNRLFLDENGTITMHNITESDQGKYFVIQKKDQLPRKQEVYVQIPEAPSKNCIPKIERVGNTLFASLEPEKNCGRPVVTTYWKGHNGSSDIHDQIQTIAEGGNSGLYTACIEGPALKCEQNVLQRNQCSSFIIRRSTKGTGSTAPICTDCLFFRVFGCICISCILLLCPLGFMTLYKHSGYKTKMKYNEKLQTQYEEQPRLKKSNKKKRSYKLQTQYDEQHRLKDNNKKKSSYKLQTQYDEQHRLKNNNTFRSPTINEDDLVHTYLNKLEWEDILNMLNSDQQQGLQIYCKNCKSPSINEDELVHKYLDRLNGMDIIRLLNLVQRKDLERHFRKYMPPRDQE